MLKRQLQKAQLDIGCYIFEYAYNIKAVAERDLLIKTIFHGSPKARYISWDYNWCIRPGFDIVCDALLHLSGIKIELGLLGLRDPASIYIKTHIEHTFNTLRDGLIAYGCFYAPILDTNVTTNVDTVLEMAHQVLTMSLSQVATNYIDCL